MRLFLIRHGETVDNVAQVYAGVKDSALTVHGSLQVERLGKFLAKSGLEITHIFTSDLQRAVKTAGAIQSWSEAAQPRSKVEVTALKCLREQDFGYYEGKPFYARPRDSSKSGKDAHRSEHVQDPDFKDVESKESMASRMNHFLRDDLVPLIHRAAEAKEKAMVIVSHGIILSQLWKSILKLLSKDSVSLAPGVSSGLRGTTSLEHLGGWSNTGYLEIDLHRRNQATANEDSRQSRSSQSPKADNQHNPSISLASYKVVIKTINGTAHLQGLKRTKGGVGSSKFDEDQKSIDSFFKKRKLTTGEK